MTTFRDRHHDLGAVWFRGYDSGMRISLTSWLGIANFYVWLEEFGVVGDSFILFGLRDERWLGGWGPPVISIGLKKLSSWLRARAPPASLLISSYPLNQTHMATTKKMVILCHPVDSH
jgi:hypothetical protein